ncbi:MAG: AAA family ATPase [Nostoc desertorum CM1-VF14]|jgi:predicted ATPase|nr:AAA family ATPase [Nostoc desertorum CM1-VF14]
MLKQLILENWKSFRYAELPLDPLTILIGTNASGKSNVVEALEFLQRIVKGREIEDVLSGYSTLPSIRGGVEWAALKPETQFTLKSLIQGHDDLTDYFYKITIKTKPNAQVFDEYIIRKEPQHENNSVTQEEFLIKTNFDQELSVLMTDVFNRDNQSVAVYGSDNKISVLNFVKYIELDSNKENIQDKILGDEINVVVQCLDKIFILNPIPAKMRDYSRLSDNLESDASNIAGLLAALDGERKIEVEKTLSTYIKDLPEGDIQKVWAEKVGRFGSDAMLYCQEGWKPGHITEIDARTMSDGTLRFLAILTALLTRPEGSQLVIEEIDNGLHPSRAELLVRILREIGSKRKIDILLTTHNPALLDALGPDIVPFVVVAHRDKETGESKLTLLEDIDNFSKLFASYSLGDMTTKGAIERSLSRNE